MRSRWYANWCFGRVYQEKLSYYPMYSSGRERNSDTLGSGILCSEPKPASQDADFDRIFDEKSGHRSLMEINKNMYKYLRPSTLPPKQYWMRLAAWNHLIHSWTRFRRKSQATTTGWDKDSTIICDWEAKQSQSLDTAWKKHATSLLPPMEVSNRVINLKFENCTFHFEHSFHSTNNLHL